MYRLYIDEVGTASLTHLEKDRHRYLSLSGVAMDIRHAAETLEPNMNWIKAKVLNHDPDSPVVFHRTDILGLGGHFQCLRDARVRDKFNQSILRLFISTEFKLITAIIDKKAMLTNSHWNNKEPYHYLMDIIVEKYTQLLERKGVIGDIMPEKRGAKQDDPLQKAFSKTRADGTYYVNSDRIKSAIRADKLKFRTKKENIAGLQLCDLLAHPSHIYARKLAGHDVRLGEFSEKISGILINSKYDRSATGKIIGYGIKWAS